MATIRNAAAQAFERKLVEQNRELVENWGKYLDAPAAPKLENDTERYLMARMLESTRKELSEATQTTSVFGSNYVQSMLGMIRQIFPRLIGTQLVGVQPLDRPSGKVFTLDFLRDDDSNVDVFKSWDTYRSYADHSAGEGAAIAKGMKLSITSSDVSVGNPKKLLVSASLELSQDLRAYHNLDANDILQGAAVDEVVREIDSVIVRMVRDAAIANKTITFGKNAPTGYTAAEWRTRLQRAILLANNHLYKNRGVEGTWLLCGADAALELMDLNTFQVGNLLGSEQGSYGLQAVGSLGAQFQVYRSQYVTANEIIVGRKGASILEAGAFWLPYVPLFVSDRVFDVGTQKFEQSFMSRYATHRASDEYFARVVIDDAATGIA